MTKVKKVKVKSSVIKVFKFIGILLCVFVIAFLFYRHEINTITKIGYSEQSSNYILFHNLKKYIQSVGENKTLDAAFSSEYYKSEYLEKYRDIKYVDHKHLIKNINTLIEKGYSISNINMIFDHGNDDDVSAFAKRDKVKYLEEFYSVPYAKLRNYDRYIAYSDETGEDDEETVLIVNLDLDKEDYTDYTDVTEFSFDMLVNKHRKLSEDFVPNDLVEIEKPYSSSNELYTNKVVLNAFIEMYNAAKNEGYGLVINSAYRSYEDQVELCDTYAKLYGEDYVRRYVASPGFSEHQTGLGLDIGSTSVSIFANSKEYVWMQDNAYKYGFIMRYPKKYIPYTGINNEPWHYRYVGVKIATYMHENNISFEEYYATFLDD